MSTFTASRERAHGVVKGCRVRTELGAVGIQVDAEINQNGERPGLPKESSGAKRDLPVVGACASRETRDIARAFGTDGSRQRQPGPSLEKAFVGGEFVVKEGRVPLAGSGAGVNEQVDEIELDAALP